jgi:LuxR family transcriptional regulator, maltose regulon positive regulatory protein
MSSVHDSLLATKLYAPPLRPKLVHRPRLLERMAQGLQGGARLTLVTAPAGYGKTTLALAWLESLGRPYGWLSLDVDDNQPLQFLAYFRAVLQPALGGETTEAPGVPDGPDTDSPSPDADHLQARLRTLINQLAEHPNPFVLALDDYHVITEVAVHEAVAYLLDHLPPQVHMVITTRQDPLLPLSRLRSRGQLTEIRLGELRFSEAETAGFLNDLMKLGLTPNQIADLSARTEGWIAGLQLAGLSLSLLPDSAEASADAGQRARYIAAFTGDDRHVMDYLMDEVLSRQPDQVQQFLLQTSVLKQLCGALCDAVMEEPSSAHGEPAFPPSAATARGSAVVLEHLEQANLFVIPLDNRRQWYRYHHLFADLLRSRLQATDLARVASLHGRASRWYEGAGLFGDAIDHALLAEDFDRALRLMEHTAQTSLWASGDLPVLLTWARRLPDEALLTRPRLCLYIARGLFFAGQVDVAEHYLGAAQRALEHRGPIQANGDELWGILYTNQATVQAMYGATAAAFDLARQARVHVPAADHSTHARIAHAVGMAAYLHGDVQAAQAAFSEAVQLGQQAKNHILGLDAASCLALTLVLAGRLRLAEQTCRQALPAGAGQPAPAASAVYLALAHIQFAQNALHEAQATLGTCGTLSRKAGWPHVLWQAHVLQAQIFQAVGNYGAAGRAISAAEQVAHGYNIPRVARQVAAARARLALAAGDLALADRWQEDYGANAPAEGQHDFEELTLARVWLAQSHYAEALSRTQILLEQAGPAARRASVIEADLIQALALRGLGEPQGALDALLAALELAAPENFVQVFIGAGSDLAEWLGEVRHQVGAREAVAGVIDRILAVIVPEPAASPPLFAPTTTNHTEQAGALVEPLSKRELEVLVLIAEGLTNPEIAARLFLSVNTLRAHTTNIYQKMDVHSRVQAVTRAQQIGLLPMPQ